MRAAGARPTRPCPDGPGRPRPAPAARPAGPWPRPGPAAGARPRPTAAGHRATCGRPTRRRGGSPGRPAPGRGSGARRGRGRRELPPRTAPRSTRRRRSAVRGVRLRGAGERRVVPERVEIGGVVQQGEAQVVVADPFLSKARDRAGQATRLRVVGRSTAFEATAKARAAA